LSAGEVLGSTYRELASVFAQCSGIARKDLAAAETTRAALVEQYAVRAVNLLAFANDKGFFTKPERVADLRTDDRLQPIMDRDDFKKFQLELEKTVSARASSTNQAK